MDLHVSSTFNRKWRRTGVRRRKRIINIGVAFVGSVTGKWALSVEHQKG